MSKQSNDEANERALAWQKERGVPTLVALGGDLAAAFENNTARPSAPIVDVIAAIEGANDGPSWHWLALLDNGHFAYITGGCDYTGWD
jgi:hypothetical protein